MRKLICLMAFVFVMIGCRDEGDPYELLRKLRGFGIEANPVVAVQTEDGSDQTVSLTFHAVVPLGDEVSAEPYVDDGNPFAIPVQTLQKVDGSESYTDYTHFRHYSVQAQFVVGDVSKLPQLALGGEAVTMRYGMKLTSPGEEEKMVGDLVVAQADSDVADMNLTAPSLDIEPASDVTIAKEADQDIKASYESSDYEKYKIGWFVSQGEIENRRSKETTWLTGSEETQTVIFTVRGKKTKLFSYKIIEYNAN